MNLSRIKRLSPLLGVSLLILIASSEGVAGSSVTYQGRLLDDGQPASGEYAMRFRLCDAVSGGSYVGLPLLEGIVAVTNGTFTVLLDFGGEAPDGAPRWVEIGVRAKGSTADYTLLSPRQELTAAPYARYALRAGVSETASVASLLANGGAGLTNVPGTSIQAGSISALQMEAGTDAEYRSGGGQNIYILPETGNSPGWLGLTTVDAGLASTNLSLDLRTGEMFSAVCTQGVTVGIVPGRAKPFWLYLTNSGPTAIALGWPSDWLWHTAKPGTLGAGKLGVLSGVSDATGRVAASWAVSAP